MSAFNLRMLVWNTDLGGIGQLIFVPGPMSTGFLCIKTDLYTNEKNPTLIKGDLQKLKETIQKNISTTTFTHQTKATKETSIQMRRDLHEQKEIYITGKSRSIKILRRHLTHQTTVTKETGIQMIRLFPT